MNEWMNGHGGWLLSLALHIGTWRNSHDMHVVGLRLCCKARCSGGHTSWTPLALCMEDRLAHQLEEFDQSLVHSQRCGLLALATDSGILRSNGNWEPSTLALSIERTMTRWWKSNCPKRRKRKKHSSLMERNMFYMLLVSFLWMSPLSVWETLCVTKSADKAPLPYKLCGCFLVRFSSALCSERQLRAVYNSRIDREDLAVAVWLSQKKKKK